MIEILGGIEENQEEHQLKDPVSRKRFEPRASGILVPSATVSPTLCLTSIVHRTWTKEHCALVADGY
jgi:hypothetical protein